MVPAGLSWSVKGSRRLPGRSLLPFQRQHLCGLKTSDSRAKTELESYDGCCGLSTSKFPPRPEVPVKSNRTKSEVPAAASRQVLHLSRSHSSTFPHPLFTLNAGHPPYPILQPRSRHYPILALALAHTIPLGSAQFVSGFPILLLVPFVLPVLHLPGIASPTLLLPVAVCIYSLSVLADTEVAIVLSTHSCPSRLDCFVLAGRPPPILVRLYYPSMQVSG